MYGESITYTQAVIVCIFSLIVVFAVLQAITYMINIVAWLTNCGDKKRGLPVPPEATKAVPAAAPASVDSHIDVVLITAAVAACLGKDTSSFVVRSIRRIGTEETAWNRAGRLNSLQ